MTKPRATAPRSARPLATGSQAWQGSKPEEHATRDQDSNNVQGDASREGREERASGSDNSTATSEKAPQTGGNRQAQKDHPEAPRPVIGMNDERGGKGH
ncbi:MAG: hypothetical protein M1818_004176 [Claussenomyces sp. TS43310]|nr:MAG: hypothetical protein M1818_004176 [Claussenomyces sp. TS43310]